MFAVTAAQLLRFELAVLLAAAALLLAVPMTIIRVFGLPTSASTFWPRLVGALLLGLVAALLATDQGWLTLSTARGPLATGLGLGALVSINLTSAFVLATMLVFGTDVPTRRGRAVLWALTVALALLGLIEIAYVV